MKELVEGREVGLRAVFLRGDPADDMFIIESYVIEPGRTASRQALTESVPIVVSRDAGCSRGYSNTDVLVTINGRSGDPVRVNGACAVIFLPIEYPVPVAANERDGVLRRLGAFRHGSTHQCSTCNPAQPQIARRRVLAGEPAFYEGEVGAEDLRNVGVRLGKLHEEAKQLGNRRAVSAMRLRHADRSEAGLAQQLNSLERQLALLLAADCILRDALEEGPEAGAQVFTCHGL